jgi:hypothetical protein
LTVPTTRFARGSTRERERSLLLATHTEPPPTAIAPAWERALRLRGEAMNRMMR